MTRFCGTCGTEVDETAVFCPTCGQPIDQEVETEMPAAPRWPDPEPAGSGPSPHDQAAERHLAGPPAAASPPADAWATPPDAPSDAEPPPGRSSFEEPLVAARPAEPAPAPTPDVAPRPLSGPRAEPGPAPAARPPAPRPTWDEPTRAEARPRPDHFDDSTAPPRPDGAATSPTGPAPRTAGAPSPARDPRREPAPPGPAIDLPITMPVTLSAWLIGVGAALGAVGALVSLFDGFGAAVDLVALVALAAVALSVFFSAAVSALPQLRLITLAVVLVAFGIGLDRLGLGGASGVGELLLFLGSAAAVIGAILLELGRDQPLGPPQR